MYTFLEKDWKLLKKRLPGWQERYMEQLVEDYKEILNGDYIASEKFWTLYKKINQDQRKGGVMVEGLSRSNMVYYMIELYEDGAIEMKDLAGFSDGLIEVIQMHGR